MSDLLGSNLALRSMLSGGSEAQPRAAHVPAPGPRLIDRQARSARLHARYDAISPDPINDAHWRGADSLSARAANSAFVRQRLRNFARYERDNNSIAAGMINTLAGDTIGSGPRLQIMADLPDDAIEFVESEFEEWALAIDLAGKLSTMLKAKIVDGESFGHAFTNRRLGTPVTMDLRLYEADQIATPMMNFLDDRHIDGIELDENGLPEWFHVLHRHPGDERQWMAFEYKRVRAEDMYHWFREDRPGQLRGVSELTPALQIFAQLRRYTLSVLAAAESAAAMSGILETEMPVDASSLDDSAAEDYAFDEIGLPRGSGMALPAGYKFKQIDAKFPTTTFREFVRELIAQAARVILMPYNIAAGTSEGLNYASARLDQQQYIYTAVQALRTRAERVLLNRMFRAWLNEAVLIEGYIPQSMRSIKPRLKVGWFWDGREHVDPAKASTARANDLRSASTNLAEIWGAQGMYWKRELKKRAEEIKFCKENGIPLDLSGMPTQPEGQEAESA